MSANWRGYIGLVKPTYRGKSFAFWYKNLPTGVECAPAVIGFRSGNRESFLGEEGLRRAESLSEQLQVAGCDIITISGSPPFILRGPEFEPEWQKNLESRLGIPIVTGMAPHVAAAKALGITHIALATYYERELNEGISRYFEAGGIASEIIPGYEQRDEGEGLYTTSMRGLDSVSDEDVYRHCKTGIRKIAANVDGLYINGGGWDAAPVIKYLEEDLAVPVIWALAAEMWMTLGRLGISAPVNGYGKLLSEPGLRGRREML